LRKEGRKFSEISRGKHLAFRVFCLSLKNTKILLKHLRNLGSSFRRSDLIQLTHLETLFDLSCSILGWVGFYVWVVLVSCTCVAVVEWITSSSVAV
jgi:hypothetical protein